MAASRTYHSIVLVKQVPDTRYVSGDVMTDEGTLNRSALPAIFNPEDLHALEMALRVKDQYGGQVTVLTMGPMQASAVLRDALYRGADRVALISDRKFAGADTQATSYTLQRAIDKVGDFDLVFCGRQAIDGDTAQVGPQVAEKLGVPQITYAESILDLDGDEYGRGNGHPNRALARVLIGDLDRRLGRFGLGAGGRLGGVGLGGGGAPGLVLEEVAELVLAELRHLRREFDARDGSLLGALGG